MSGNDARLLQRWNARRDAEAFNELVSRYADQVFATCRRILRNDADAEDVTQECFLRLAQTPSEVRVSLGGWLHRVATTKSLDHIRSESRRRARERQYELAGQAGPETWAEVEPEVDAAIDALPDELRVPVIAHFVERKTHAEIADALGVQRRTIGYRIDRGICEIRDRLTARGITFGAAALAALNADTMASAAPATLKASLGKLALAAGTPCAPTTGGTLWAWALGGVAVMKGKVLVALVLSAVLGLLAVRQLQRDAPVETPKPQAINASIRHEDTATDVVAADVASPPEIAPVGEETKPAQRNVVLPASTSAIMSTYLPIEAQSDYATVSGVVHDGDGYPISGAEVTLVPSHWNDDAARRSECYVTTQTLFDGVFRLTDIRFEGAYWVQAGKTGYATVSTGTSNNIPLNISAGTEIENIAIALPKGIELRGQVVAKNLGAVRGAIVQCLGSAGKTWASTSPHIVARANSSGEFTMGFTQEGYTAFRVHAPGFCAQSFAQIAIQSDKIVFLRLETPAWVTGRVVRRSSTPVVNAIVRIDSTEREIFGGMPDREATRVSAPVDYSAVPDDEGRFRIEVQPGVDYTAQVFSADGFALTQELYVRHLQPDEEHEWNPVVDEAPPVVRGHLIGKRWGRPVETNVFGLIRVTCVRDGREVDVSGGVDIHGRFEIQPVRGAGTYRFQASYELSDDARLRGPLSEVVRLQSGDDREVVLKVPDPQRLAVRVVDESGRPLGGGSVSYLNDAGDRFNIGVRVGDDGVPDAPLYAPPYSPVQVRVELAGYAPATGALHEGGEPGTVYREEVLVMRPSAGIEGIALDPDGAAMAGVELRAQFVAGDGQAWISTTTAAGDGHFTFLDGVPSGVLDITIEVISRGGSDTALWEGNGVALEPGIIRDMGEIALEAAGT